MHVTDRSSLCRAVVRDNQGGKVPEFAFQRGHSAPPRRHPPLHGRSLTPLPEVLISGGAACRLPLQVGYRSIQCPCALTSMQGYSDGKHLSSVTAPSSISPPCILLEPRLERGAPLACTFFLDRSVGGWDSCVWLFWKRMTSIVEVGSRSRIVSPAKFLISEVWRQAIWNPFLAAIVWLSACRASFLIACCKLVYESQPVVGDALER